MYTHSNAVKLTQQLVQIDSSNPGAGETQLAQYLTSYVQSLHSSIIRIETDEVFPGRNNLVASIPGDPAKPEFIFICHMDTVPLGDHWLQHPLSGKVENGKLYGRGSCDMKSGLACALSAFTTTALCCRTSTVPKRTLKLIATVDEEGEMCGVERAIRAKWISKNSYVLDTEPTDGEIQIAHKGRMWFQITVQGMTAHASTPWKGADAIAAMAEVITQIRSAFSHLSRHEDLGESTVTFGQIHGGSQPYVVSEQCTVTIDMRLVPPCDSAAAETIVQNAIQKAERSVPKTKISYEIMGNRPIIEKDASSMLLKKLQASITTISGAPAKVGVFNGYTDSAVIAGQLKNHNCMSYGPGNLELAHKPNEYVPISDILRCEKVLTELALQCLY